MIISLNVEYGENMFIKFRFCWMDMNMDFLGFKGLNIQKLCESSYGQDIYVIINVNVNVHKH
jgi:hypothetical protein